jgi:hypothetical protein
MVDHGLLTRKVMSLGGDVVRINFDLGLEPLLAKLIRLAEGRREGFCFLCKLLNISTIHILNRIDSENYNASLNEQRYLGAEAHTAELLRPSHPCKPFAKTLNLTITS